MFRRAHTKVYRGYLLRKYPTEPYRSVRYGRNTQPNTPVRFGTNSIPVPDTSVSSARPQYLYPTLGSGFTPYIGVYTLNLSECSVRRQYPTKHSGKVRYELDTGTRHFGKFGTTPISVPDTSVRVFHRIPGAYALAMWFGTASIPYRKTRYSSASNSMPVPGTYGKFGTTAMPAQNTLVSSVRLQYRCLTLRSSSVLPPKLPRVSVYPAAHTLANSIDRYVHCNFAHPPP